MYPDLNALIQPELRNRIYEIAADSSRRTFPPTHLKPKKSRSGKSEVRRLPLRPLPYIGLTQVCSSVRKEFRPLWLSTHCFPLYVMDGYLKVFFPAPLRASQVSEQVRERIKSYCDPAGTLRLWINHDSLDAVDIQKLLRFRLRFPDYTIRPIPACSRIPKEAVNIFSAILNIKNPKWIKWLNQHVITQVRLRTENRHILRVVIKASHFPGRGKFSFLVHNHEIFVKSLGLKDVGCFVNFGVEY